MEHFIPKILSQQWWQACAVTRAS